jgi:hypothetical protein
MGSAARFKTIIPPHLIAAKVTGSGGVDPEAVRRAEAAVAELRAGFERHAAEQIAQMQVLQARFAPGAEASETLARLFQLAHDLKGQAGTFGYGLLSQIGDLLCRYAEHGDTGAARGAGVLKALIDAMAAILARKVTGDGDALGRQVLLELQHLTGRLDG